MATAQVLQTNPKTKIRLLDDFIANTGSGNAGTINWLQASTGAGAAGASGSVIPPDTTHQGILGLGTGTTTTGRSSILLSQTISTGTMKPYSGTIRQSWLVQVPNLSTVTDRYALRLGFGDSITADMANGIYFEYDDSASLNWRLKTASSSTRTTVDSGVAVAQGVWILLEIFSSNASASFSYAINGTTVGTISSNMPTSDISPILHIIKSAGTTSRTVWIDYFLMEMILSSSR